MLLNVYCVGWTLDANTRGLGSMIGSVSSEVVSSACRIYRNLMVCTMHPAGSHFASCNKITGILCKGQGPYDPLHLSFQQQPPILVRRLLHGTTLALWRLAATDPPYLTRICFLVKCLTRLCIISVRLPASALWLVELHNNAGSLSSRRGCNTAPRSLRLTSRPEGVDTIARRTFGIARHQSRYEIAAAFDHGRV